MAGTPSFEEATQQNLDQFWSARWLGKVLGYDDYTSFLPAIERAINACAILDIATADNFRQRDHDYELSRFASYLTVINADSGRKSVADAQVFLAGRAAMMSLTRRHTAGWKDPEEDSASPRRTRARRPPRR